MSSKNPIAAAFSSLVSTVTSRAAPTPRPAVGDKAPSFSLESTAGDRIRLEDYAGRTVVLAFYPRAFTPGCSKEMRGLGATHQKFLDQEAQILGISTDDLDTQKKFSKSLQLPFPLLADPDSAVAKAYGVDGMFFSSMAHRVTFVIGPDGNIVQVIEGGDAIDPLGTLAACPLRPPGA
jgi:peroxiredoxin Q/BCP